ncbi:uncharacterized protein [Watersipora subatra]|uniref:uncharacterized protein n=1 Tax=Watersipora subatra TaxID=2589382 RepID=UPI00355BC703
MTKYTVEKETRLFTLLARSGTELCQKEECVWTAVASELTRRRKRSTDSVTFYKEYFSRLPGYPQENNGDLNLAAYSLVPGSGVLSSGLLKRILQDASANISAALGASIINIAVYQTVAPTMQSTPEASTVLGRAATSNVIILVGVGSGLVVLTGIIVLIVFLIKSKKRKQVGQSPEPLSYTKTAKLVDEEARSEHLKTTRNTTVVLYGGQREIKSGARETPVNAPVTSVAWE